MRYLGIDYGDAHVGIALGETETHIAVPLETIPFAGLEKLGESLRSLAAREGADALVVGVPRIGRGEMFVRQQKKIENVAAYLKENLSLPVFTADESFTTIEAQRIMRETNPVPGVDEHAIAAMLILQAYLDSIST